ncbi:MAG TPA: DNA modification methylase [Tepidisphaeraceae bacterium]|nr:DNA modification methylase [Tepidisphaeraceae bacterium]
MSMMTQGLTHTTRFHFEREEKGTLVSLREFGFRQPIVVDGEGVIIVGHTRWRAAKQLGLAQVPVHVATDLTPAQVKAYRLADNATNELAEWDYDLLPIELSALRDEHFDLGLLGFDPEELERLLSGEVAQGLTDPDEVPELPEEATTREGDLWQLGDHRLLCGNSTVAPDVAALMGRERARMMFTDPPWNVAIGSDANPKHRQRRGLANDDLPPEQFAQFLSTFVGNAKPHIDGDVYCVLGASEWPTLDATLRSHGYHWSATVIWAKDAFVLGRSKYHRRYEPIWYGWHGKGQSSFNDRRDLDDVWEVPRPRRSEEHPTMKPVQLPLRAIANSSVRGDVILDLFGGLGSTLIAAEQAGRRAYLMELDPTYCDGIVRRWEAFTGQNAERVSP